MSSSENLSGRTLGQAAGDAPRGRRQIRIASEDFRKTSVDEFFFDDEEFPKSPEGNKIITADTINELLENMSSGKILMRHLCLTNEVVYFYQTICLRHRL